MLLKYLAFIGRAERAAANPDEGEILPVLPMNALYLGEFSHPLVAHLNAQNSIVAMCLAIPDWL